jgi:Bacterial antitoxin of type II TA system, VapB
MEPDGRLTARLAVMVIMCELSHMATNIDIDETLLDEALRVGGHRTKKATVNEALAEYVLHRKQAGVVRLFGTIDMDPAYDYKKQRRKK